MPSGIIGVSINTNSNSIEFVSASHDREGDKTRDIKELKSINLQKENIKKVYDVALKAIGEENIFCYEKPFVRVFFNSSFARFEVSPSKNEPNKIKDSVKVDLKTYTIIDNKSAFPLFDTIL